MVANAGIHFVKPLLDSALGILVSHTHDMH